jgi:hypothetical protein
MSILNFSVVAAVLDPTTESKQKVNKNKNDKPTTNQRASERPVLQRNVAQTADTAGTGSATTLASHRLGVHALLDKIGELEGSCNIGSWKSIFDDCIDIFTQDSLMDFVYGLSWSSPRTWIHGYGSSNVYAGDTQEDAIPLRPPGTGASAQYCPATGLH